MAYFLFFVFESYLVCCDRCVVDGIKKDVIRRVLLRERVFVQFQS